MTIVQMVSLKLKQNEMNFSAGFVLRLRVLFKIGTLLVNCLVDVLQAYEELYKIGRWPNNGLIFELVSSTIKIKKTFDV